MNNTYCPVPPGFRFHPTDEELVDYYLRKKVTSRRIDLDVIKEIDLYKIEPWDLQEKCRIGAEEQHEWYFFSHKDKKYPTGTRTNRATVAGFWKATGRDKPIYSKHSLIGMRKTLVFYKGRAPNGKKSDWIMHEYRLETNENNGGAQEEGWVVCRVFKKRVMVVRRSTDHESPCWQEEQVAFAPTSIDMPSTYHHHHQQQLLSCKQEIGLSFTLPHETFLQLPQLESPTVNYYLSQGSSSITQEEPIQPLYLDHVKVAQSNFNPSNEQSVDQVTDWRILDKFVASQLSQGGGVSKETHYSNPSALFQVCDK